MNLPITVMQIHLPAATAISESGNAADRLLWWVVPLSLVTIMAMTLLESVERLSPKSVYRRVAERAAHPLIAAMVMLTILTGWRLSETATSLLAVGGMVLLELCKTLPEGDGRRRLVDGFSGPLIAMALAVILVSGWQLARIIGFVA